MKITPRKKQLMDFVNAYTSKYGFAPSIPEIAKKLKRAGSTVHQHLEELKAGGHISREKNQRRSVVLPFHENMVSIPLLGTIAAGEPIHVFTDQEKETIAVPKNKLPKSGEVYALRVQGESMVDEGINHGDTILVKKQQVAENGQKVVALLDNNEATLKTFYREKNGIRLQPANKNFKPIIIKNGGAVNLQGVLFETIHAKQTSISLPVFTSQNKKKILPINQIIHGDAVEIMAKMPEECIDLTVTSPPYDELRDYNGYRFDFENMARQLFRITKIGGVLVWVVGDKIKNGNKSLTSFKQALFFQQIGFNVHDVMIYKKRNTPFMRSNGYTNAFEFMFVLSKKSPKTFHPLKTNTVRQGEEMLPHNKGADGINKKILKELKAEKTLTNIWEYAVGLHGTTSDKIAFKHPAVFPEKLAEDHILSWTEIDDIIFDPMCGSGTTCKMALKNKRRYIGCDISKEYVEIAQERIRLNKLS